MNDLDGANVKDGVEAIQIFLQTFQDQEKVNDDKVLVLEKWSSMTEEVLVEDTSDCGPHMVGELVNQGLILH